MAIPFRSEKLVAGATEIASVEALKDTVVSSSEGCLTTMSPEGLITTSPGTTSHNTASSDVPKTVSHNTIDSSPSTLQSSCGKPVSGSAEAIPTQQDQDDLFLDRAIDELIDEFLGSSSVSTTDSPWTVPHNATNGFQQPAPYTESEILIRRHSNCYQAFYIRIDRMGSFWTYPDVGGPFPSIHEAEVAIIYFIAELRHAARCKEQYEFSCGDSNYSYFLKGPPKRDPNSQSSKTTYDEKQYLVQAILDQYNGDNNLFGDLAHKLKDLVKVHWIIESPWWYYHFNFTTKQQADDSTGNKLFFAEASHLPGEKTFEIKCCGIIETKGDNCYGCRNNRDPMQHPKKTNAYTGGCFVDCPGVILSDYDDDDDYDYDDDDGDDFDFEVDDDGDDDDGEDGDDEVDDVVKDCNVGHTGPKVMLDECV